VTSAPTPPIAFPGQAGALTSRFAAVAVDMPEGFVELLRSACDRVTDDDTARAEAGRDWWPLALRWALAGEVPARPAVVTKPASTAEVAAVLAACHEAGVPVTATAGRSGVCGASVPAFGGVALDLTGLQGIAAVDQESMLVDVLPGTFGDAFEDTLRQEHGLTVGHWPQSMALSTVGGWLACRGAGQYSTRYGKIEDMAVGLEVVLADGRVVDTGGRAPRAAAGPDLTQLFVGSEGTLGVITRARLRAHPVPPTERRAAYRFAGASESDGSGGGFTIGLDACRRIVRRGATPAVLRLYDPREAKRNFSVDDAAVLIVLDEGDPGLIDAVMAVVAEECAALGGRPDDVQLVSRWLEHRNDVSALESLTRAGIVVDTIEIAARWSALPSIYDQAVAALTAIEGTVAATAHQSHAYTDGACLYFTFAGHPSAEDADAYYLKAWDAVTRTVLSLGGALSHHHGVGLNRSRYMPAALGPALDVLASVKAALDPKGILNPGKLGLPSRFGEVPWP
jgi:alkyldihydroxyacetonephosphate synthase